MSKNKGDKDMTTITLKKLRQGLPEIQTDIKMR